MSDPPVMFRASTPDREVAYLGAVLIGEVRRQEGLRRHQAIWALWLPPDSDKRWRPAGDLAEAKRALTDRVGDWCAAARLRPIDG